MSRPSSKKEGGGGGGGGLGGGGGVGWGGGGGGGGGIAKRLEHCCREAGMSKRLAVTSNFQPWEGRRGRGAREKKVAFSGWRFKESRKHREKSSTRLVGLSDWAARRQKGTRTEERAVFPLS